MNRISVVGWCVFAALAASCSPKVYLVDRQTILEDEAAGEWPEFEKDILRRTQASGPTPFPTTAASARKARLFNVLNGELVSSNSDTGKKSAGEKATPAPAPGEGR